MVIQAHNLSFQYDDTPLLQDISLEISKGECVAIFGPNGGGKTTLLKLFMGFLKPSSGTLLINGAPPYKSRKSMGYVPQISHLDRQFPITALDVVKMGALSPSIFQSYSKGAHEEALSMLAKVGLSDMAQTPFGSLSGGQSQRVLIARALMGHPDYLFLDEATASVDPSAEKHFHDLLNTLKGTITIVLVTHDLPTEMSYVDRFLCVYRTITPFSPTQVCDHFAKGLYHPPLRKKGNTSC
jgi:zinc transport system ATP-binding protein